VNGAHATLTLVAGQTDRDERQTMRFALYLVIAGMLAAATAALPSRGRSALKQDTCFSDSAPADQRIVACSAAIRSARQGSSLKALALLNRAGAYGPERRIWSCR
jgi:hypothetical protein